MIERMPELKWNEHEVIECLGVLPKVDDYETGHHFRVEKDEIILVLSIWQYDCLVEISLYQSNKKNPLINFHISVRDEIKFINDKRGSFLRFQDCSVISSMYPLTESMKFYKMESPEFLNMALEVEPEIRIQFTK